MKRWSVYALVAAATVGIVGAGLWYWISAGKQETAVLQAEPTATAAGTAEAAAAMPQVVTLTDAKLQAAGVQLAEVTSHRLQPFHTVPGRLQYDDQRHIEVRVATGGILTDVRVKPGDRVEAGQILAELNSAEVGNARADVLQREAELELALRQRDWDQAAWQGLEKMYAAIQQRLPLDQIRQQFRDVALGSSREKILTHYSQLILSESLMRSAETNVASGVVPQKVLQERQSERDTAEASLQGTLEQLRFDAQQSVRESEMRVQDTQRRVRISRQHVATLLGLAEGHDAAEGASASQPAVLSLVQIRAPFAGTIEQRRFSLSERVAAGDGVFVLADTSTLWVAAELRDRDRGALSLQTGDTLDVFLSPADASPVSAVVSFIGREVDPATNAVPVIAVIQNADGRLRPGMFVHVRVPIGAAQDALAVPESALLEHESRQFLFVPQDERSFRRVEVTVGQRYGELVEIRSGITAGERVVVAGSFTLKSELLLEGEEE